MYFRVPVVLLFGWMSVVYANAPAPLKRFYFPYANMMDTVVYRYSDEPGESDVYWVMFTTVENADTFFYTCSFSSFYWGGGSSEIMKERITANGAVLVAMNFKMTSTTSLVYQDSSAVVKDEVFTWSWEDRDSLYFETHTLFTEPSNALHVSGKTRKWLGTESLIYQQQATQALVFSDEFSTRTYDPGTKEMDGGPGIFKRKSYYAENIGLVRFDQEEMGQNISFVLREIIPFRNWALRSSFLTVFQAR